MSSKLLVSSLPACPFIVGRLHEATHFVPSCDGGETMLEPRATIASSAACTASRPNPAISKLVPVSEILMVSISLSLPSLYASLWLRCIVLGFAAEYAGISRSAMALRRAAWVLEPISKLPEQHGDAPELHEAQEV
jgi:hypothetical protein